MGMRGFTGVPCPGCDAARNEVDPRILSGTVAKAVCVTSLDAQRIIALRFMMRSTRIHVLRSTG